MPFINTNIILEQELTKGGEVGFPYPDGCNEASFLGAFNHTVVSDDVFYKSPVDFVISPQHDQLVFAWHKDKKLEAGSILHLRLEQLGTSYYQDPRTNVTLMNVMPAPSFLVNLKAPLAADNAYYFAPASLDQAGKLSLRQTKPDVPRNVTILSTANDTQVIFKIHGVDCYDRRITEYIPGPNAGIQQGKKAFAKLLAIQASGGCQGKIAIGFGNRLGLPVYLPAEGYVLQEMINGHCPTSRGMIIPGEYGLPTPQSGDRRGTYTPAAGIRLDGRQAIYLLVALPNPGNIGAADYFENP
jgi:hypothetical protein